MPGKRTAIRALFILGLVVFGAALIFLKPASISEFSAVLALMVILLGAVRPPPLEAPLALREQGCRVLVALLLRVCDRACG